MVREHPSLSLPELALPGGNCASEFLRLAG